MTAREKASRKTQFEIKDQLNPLHLICTGSYSYLKNEQYHRKIIHLTCRTGVHTSHYPSWTIQVSPDINIYPVLKKEQIEARLCSLDYSRMSYRLSYSIVCHFKSFVAEGFGSTCPHWTCKDCITLICFKIFLLPTI